MSKIRVRKRGKTYSYNFEVSVHPRRQKEKGGFATRQEAYDAGVAAYTDWKTGNIGLISGRVKIKDFLTAWLKNVAKPNVKKSTYRSYLNRVTKRIIPYLGEKILQELRPRDVDAWLKQLAKNGMARTSLEDSKMVLSTALKYAIYPSELIRTNPVTGVPVPQSTPKKVIKRTVIAPEQFAAIPTTGRFYPVFKLMYHTGLRLSEALGLTWDDIDLTSGEVRVVRQRLREGYFETPKTATSTRTFYADAALLSFLRVFKASQARDELRLGEVYQLAYEDTHQGRAFVTLPKKLRSLAGMERRPLVCVYSDGTPYRHTSVASALKRMGLNAHSFRHTHATRLIEAGAKAVDVAARLGHKDAAITQNLYTHDTAEMQKETARIFGELAHK